MTTEFLAYLAASFGAGVLIATIMLMLLRRRDVLALDQQLQHKEKELLVIQERFRAQEAKTGEIEIQRDRLNDALENERRNLTRIQQELARLETQLVEQKGQAEKELETLKEVRESMRDGFKTLASDIFESKQKEFKSQSSDHLKGILDPLKEKIEKFEKKVGETYETEARERHSLERELKSLRELNAKISEDAVNLTNALKGESKTQGVWGEVVLERVLESSGLEKGREYDVQVSLKSEDGQRYQPDAIVRLPEGKDVIVDSKVSLTAYEKFCSTDDDEERAAALTAHVLSIRTHVKTLAEKDYQSLQGVRTLDYVLMFVPIESALSAAIQESNDLYSEALSKQIAIVTPSTLLATLRTIQNMWRIEQQNKNAEEIADKAGKLYDKFVGFVEDLETIGSRLSSTQSAYNDAYNKLVEGRGNIVRRSQELKSLGAKTRKNLPDNLVELGVLDDKQKQ